MATRDDRRSLHIAGAILALLFIQVIAANLLWPGPPPASAEQIRMPPTASPFPPFPPVGPILHVATVDANANLSMRLLMTSLQGLVNRVQVELYLDVGGVAGNTSTMLSFLAARYKVTYDIVSSLTAIDMFAPRTRGLVVYDPTRSESINIATMIAANKSAVLVGPDLAGWMHARYGLPILFDYAMSDWASLDPVAASDRALRELYPGCTTTLLSILPPDRWATRDYLIATRTFVFYQTQGILASPAETAATMRVLRATPRGIPILGWFNSPTVTEENAFVQMASAEGKFVVGAQSVPNLSVLAALGRNGTHRQVPPPPATNTLENKMYAVLAVPDGDNVDFIAGRMRELWSEPERGTMPIAWGIDPLLVDLAPPLLDAYYDTATPLDRFIAAPSGAGYLYPDYTGPGDLASYVAFTKRYMDAADLNVAWLLNAFPAAEIPYSDATLSAYVSGLRPAGLVLDYDDQPKTRDAWVVAGANTAAPVVRSTHFWTTTDNLLGKLGAAMATWDAGPHFLWITVYTFRYDLRDAHALVDTLSARSGGNLEVVTPAEFFQLLRQDFVQRAAARLEAMQADPVAGSLFASSMEAARSQVLAAQAALASGETDIAAYDAYRALDELRGVAAAEALIASLAIVVVAGSLALLAVRSSKPARSRRESFDLAPAIFLTAAIALLVFALREAIEQNFWTYPSILLGVAVAGVHRPLRKVLDRAYPERAPVATALVSLVFAALAIRTSVAFPLAMIGTLLAVDAYLARRPASPSVLLASLGFGTATGLIAGFDLPSFTALAILLVLPTITLRRGLVPEAADARSSRPLRAIFTGFLLALPLGALSIAFSYSLALRLDLQGDRLSLIAAAVLVIGPTLAILADRGWPHVASTIGRHGGLLLGVVFSGGVLVSRGMLPTTLALLGLFASLSYAALAGLREFSSRGGKPIRALASAIGFLPLFLLFFRAPPITISLVLVPLPEAIEYVLYAPTALIAVTAIALAIGGWFVSRRRDAGKDYPAEGHGGVGGP